MGLILTVWVPLVDATEERGCLWVMPRMHKGGLFFHKPDDMAHYLVIPDEEFGGRQAVLAPVPKGGVLLLTNRTPHASFENKTDVVRWSMDLRYESAACRLSPKSPACPATVPRSRQARRQGERVRIAHETSLLKSADCAAVRTGAQSCASARWSEAMGKYDAVEVQGPEREKGVGRTSTTRSLPGA